MSLNTDAFWVAYTGDGASTDFVFAPYYIDQSELLITVAPPGALNQPITQLQDVNYTVIDAPVDGVRSNGGTIHFLSAPAGGSTILITRRTDRSQTRAYEENDPFPAKSHEQALDKLTLLVTEIMAGYQGVADGPPSGGTRWDGGPYRQNDWYINRKWQLGGIMGWAYVDNGAGGLAWAQWGQISLLGGVL